MTRGNYLSVNAFFVSVVICAWWKHDGQKEMFSFLEILSMAYSCIVYLISYSTRMHYFCLDEYLRKGTALFKKYVLNFIQMLFSTVKTHFLNVYWEIKCMYILRTVFPEDRCFFCSHKAEPIVNGRTILKRQVIQISGILHHTIGFVFSFQAELCYILTNLDGKSVLPNLIIFGKLWEIEPVWKEDRQHGLDGLYCLSFLAQILLWRKRKLSSDKNFAFEVWNWNLSSASIKGRFLTSTVSSLIQFWNHISF